MEFGYLIVVRNGKSSPHYELDQGDHTIGSCKDSNIRLKFSNPLLLDTHAIIRVNDNGVATLLNKSTSAPVRINGKVVNNHTILKHEDKFQVVEKEFQYFNEKLKDEPEESAIFAQEKKNLLTSSRKSVMPLSKTPAKSPTYKTKAIVARTPSHSLLNKSLGTQITKSLNKSLKTPAQKRLNKTVTHASTRRSIIAGIHESSTPAVKVLNNVENNSLPLDLVSTNSLHASRTKSTLNSSKVLNASVSSSRSSRRISRVENFEEPTIFFSADDEHVAPLEKSNRSARIKSTNNMDDLLELNSNSSRSSSLSEDDGTAGKEDTVHQGPKNVPYNKTLPILKNYATTTARRSSRLSSTASSVSHSNAYESPHLTPSGNHKPLRSNKEQEMPNLTDFEKSSLLSKSNIKANNSGSSENSLNTSSRSYFRRSTAVIGAASSENNLSKNTSRGSVNANEILVTDDNDSELDVEGDISLPSTSGRSFESSTSQNESRSSSRGSARLNTSDTGAKEETEDERMSKTAKNRIAARLRPETSSINSDITSRSSSRISSRPNTSNYEAKYNDTEEGITSREMSLRLSSGSSQQHKFSKSLTSLSEDEIPATQAFDESDVFLSEKDISANESKLLSSNSFRKSTMSSGSLNSAFQDSFPNVSIKTGSRQSNKDRMSSGTPIKKEKNSSFLDQNASVSSKRFSERVTLNSFSSSIDSDDEVGSKKSKKRVASKSTITSSEGVSLISDGIPSKNVSVVSIDSSLSDIDSDVEVNVSKASDLSRNVSRRSIQKGDLSGRYELRNTTNDIYRPKSLNVSRGSVKRQQSLSLLEDAHNYYSSQASPVQNSRETSSRNRSSKRMSTFDESTQDANLSAFKNKSQNQNAFEESTKDLGSKSLLKSSSRRSAKEGSSTAQNSRKSTIDVHETSASDPNLSGGSRTKYLKRMSTFDESTQGANLSAFINKSKQNQNAFEESSTELGSTSLLTSSSRRSAKEGSSTAQNSRKSTIDVNETSASDPNISSGSRTKNLKRMSTFDESTQDANLSAFKNKSQQKQTAFEESTKDLGSKSLLKSSSRRSAREGSSTAQNSRKSTIDVHETSASDPNISDGSRTKYLKRMSTFDESTQDANLSAFKNKSQQNQNAFEESTKDLGSKSLLKSSSRRSAREGSSTAQNSRKSTIDVPETSASDPNISDGSRTKYLKRMSTFDESTQDANLSAFKNKSQQNPNAFEESTTELGSTSLLTSSSRRSAKGGSSTAQNSSKSTIDVHETSAADRNISGGSRTRSLKRVSTFDESTQDAKPDGFKNKSGQRKSTFEEPTKEILQSFSGSRLSILNKTDEVLSPVKPLSSRKSIRASRNDISNNTVDQKSSITSSLKSQMSENSSLTMTSVEHTAGSAISISSDSFSSFKKSHSIVENKREHTEIDVVNLTASTNTPETRRSLRFISGTTKTSSVEERYPKRPSLTSQMFDDVSCTSTPFHKARVSRKSQGFDDAVNAKTNARSISKTPSKSTKQSDSLVLLSTSAALKSPKLGKSRSVSLSDVEMTGAPSRRSSRNRSSFSKNGDHDCVSCRHSSVEKSRRYSVSKDSMASLKNKSDDSYVSTSGNGVEDNSTVNRNSRNMAIKSETSLVLRKSHISSVANNTPENLTSSEDETPKSHIKPTRRSSKANQSAYNPVLEDITPVTPEKLQISGFTEEAFKTPINTPGLFESIRKSVIRSRKRHRESTGSTMKDNKRARVDFIQDEEKDEAAVPEHIPVYERRQQRSPLNRLSNFEGVKKLLKTPPKSPKNDLRNIPNLRRIMSPKQQNSPKNDLTNISGVANVFNVSGIEVLHQGSDIENSEDLFVKLTGQRVVKTYPRGKSLSPSKTELLEHGGAYRKTMGDLPVCSPRVQQWVEDHAEYPLEDKDLSQQKKTRGDFLVATPDGKALKYNPDNTKSHVKILTDEREGIVEDIKEQPEGGLELLGSSDVNKTLLNNKKDTQRALRRGATRKRVMSVENLDVVTDTVCSPVTQPLIKGTRATRTRKCKTPTEPIVVEEVNLKSEAASSPVKKGRRTKRNLPHDSVVADTDNIKEDARDETVKMKKPTRGKLQDIVKEVIPETEAISFSVKTRGQRTKRNLSQDGVVADAENLTEDTLNKIIKTKKPVRGKPKDIVKEVLPETEAVLSPVKKRVRRTQRDLGHAAVVTDVKPKDIIKEVLPETEAVLSPVKKRVRRTQRDLGHAAVVTDTKNIKEDTLNKIIKTKKPTRGKPNDIVKEVIPETEAISSPVKTRGQRTKRNLSQDGVVADAENLKEDTQNKIIKTKKPTRGKHKEIVKEVIIETEAISSVKTRGQRKKRDLPHVSVLVDTEHIKEGTQTRSTRNIKKGVQVEQETNEPQSDIDDDIEFNRPIRKAIKPQNKVLEDFVTVVDSPRTARAKRGINKKYTSDEYERPQTRKRQKKVNFKD